MGKSIGEEVAAAIATLLRAAIPTASVRVRCALLAAWDDARFALPLDPADSKVDVFLRAAADVAAGLEPQPHPRPTMASIGRFAASLRAAGVDPSAMSSIGLTDAAFDSLIATLLDETKAQPTEDTCRWVSIDGVSFVRATAISEVMSDPFSNVPPPAMPPGKLN